MTQQEMETIITELETTFNQSVDLKPYSSEGFQFNRYSHESADYETKTFVQYFGVSLWFNSVLVSTITRVDQWDAFKSVARLFCQEQTIGTHTGECLECGRTSVISDSSRLCQGCTIYLTTDSQ